jgi:hypothetical protein
VSGQLVVIALVVLLIVGLVVHEASRGRRKPEAEEGGSRPIGAILRWAAIAVAGLFLLSAMSDGCEDEPDPGEPGAPVERVTCGSYRAEDCPPVTPAPPTTPPPPPATPNTAGIPEEVPA